MPKDRRTNEVKAGDPVTLMGRITAIHDNAEDATVTVQIDGPDGAYRPTVTVKSSLLALDE